MLVDVAPSSYHRASEPLVDAGRAFTRLMSTLSGTLAGSGQMAGTDSGGESFASQYDAAAARAVRAGTGLAGALGTLSNLVRTAAHNHGAADSGSTRGGGPAPPQAGATYTAVAAQEPPSADGGTGDEPGWWHYVVGHVASLVWPDADTAELRRVGAAWLGAAAGLDSVESELIEAIALLEEQRSPEVPLARTAVRRLDTLRSQLADEFRSLGRACLDHAQHVDEARSHSSHIMEGVLAGLTATAVVGIGLTLVTLGGSDAAAAAAASAEIAAGAAEVAGVLGTCATFAEEAAATLGEVGAGVGEIEAGLAPFDAADSQLAEIAAVDGAATGAPETGPRLLFRADSRDPADIFSNGFQPKGDNMDLGVHVRYDPGNSGYVASSHSMASAQDFAGVRNLDYIYPMNAEGIDVNATLGADSPFPGENEVAIPGAIEPASIQGVWGPDGWIPNPGYAR